MKMKIFQAYFYMYQPNQAICEAFSGYLNLEKSLFRNKKTLKSITIAEFRIHLQSKVALL